MPAPIPKPIQRKISQLHLEGHRNGEIAVELNLSRATVARYVGQTEKAEEVKHAPAADLTADEVVKLRAMTRVVRAILCPGCRDPILFHAEATKTYCAGCGKHWNMPKPQAMQA